MQDMIKANVSGAYDLQKLRIQMGNRIVANFKAKLGQQPGASEEELEEDEKNILADLRTRYNKITDGIKTFPKVGGFSGDEVISTYTELCLIAQYITLEDQEIKHFSRLGNMLKEYRIYNEFLAEVKGIGPAMAGVLLSEINIHAAPYPSSLWKYSGYDVGPDGAGRSRRAEHLIDREYKNKDDELATRKSITFNPFLKTKLYVLATSFIKQKDSPYRKLYDDYKHRIESDQRHADKTKGHRNNMAIRYMIKMFLQDLHRVWREQEGYPPTLPYSEAKLGHKHGGARAAKPEAAPAPVPAAEAKPKGKTKAPK